MDFRSAIKAHSDWVLKLSAYLKKPDHSLAEDKVSKDNLCALGQWLYGEATRYKTLPEYRTTLAIHAQFHEMVGKIIRSANSGIAIPEASILGTQSDLGKITIRVVTAIQALEKATLKRG